MDVQVGKQYRHYKGNIYTVLAVGFHTETKEKLVIYRAEYADPQYGPHAVWIRPYSMFIEAVAVNGEQRKRFTPID